jgi:predicted GNAT superfamily acetyltransferase
MQHIPPTLITGEVASGALAIDPDAPVSRRVMCRDLDSLDDMAAVAALESEIWGYSDRLDVAPPSLLAAAVRSGGVLIGAFDAERLVGFVFSFPIVRRSRVGLWSHRLGVLEPYRRAGLGHRLKALQRQRAIDRGLDLIEWTFDPMQAVNAHVNLVKLGAISRTYEVNMYGTSSSPLHGANPTDRLVAEWWIQEPRVAARCDGRFPERYDATALPVVNRTTRTGPWLRCDEIDLTCSADRLHVRIPTCFTDLLLGNPALAREWRLATRSIFLTYFGRGYRAVDFTFDDDRSGVYVLAHEYV